MIKSRRKKLRNGPAVQNGRYLSMRFRVQIPSSHSLAKHTPEAPTQGEGGVETERLLGLTGYQPSSKFRETSCLNRVSQRDSTEHLSLHLASAHLPSCAHTVRHTQKDSTNIYCPSTPHPESQVLGQNSGYPVPLKRWLSGAETYKHTGDPAGSARASEGPR